MKPRLILGLVLTLTVLAYWTGLAGPLVLDDRANLEPIVQWLQGHIGWQGVVFNNASGMFGRSVSMASFLANAAMTGNSVYAFKLTNLLLHLGNGIAVYALFATLLDRGLLTAKPPAAARWLPLLGASFWLLHPLLVSTVLYVIQRMAMLSALFILLTMLAYLHGRIALNDGKRQKAMGLLGVAAPLFTALAILSKENGVLAPALCGLLEWFAFAPPVGQRRPRISTAFVVLVLAMPAMLAIGLTIAGDPRIIGGYENRSFTLVERLLTQPRVIWHYVGAILLPYGPRLGLYHDDFAISHGFLSPATTAIAIIGWLCVLAAAWRTRATIPSLMLGIGIFLVGQALESTVFPLLMYFEHRIYLPSVGLIWALLGVANFIAGKLVRYMHHGRQVFAGAAVTLLLALGAATAARASVWRSQEGILLQALANHPDSRWMRMDFIGWDMAQSPPKIEDASLHAEHLMSMPNSLDRRFGAMLQLSIECIEGESPSPERIEQVFGGHPRAIEPDLLVGYESLAERITKKPCPGFSSLDMANALSSMLGRSQISMRDRSIWRLHFKAAKLYWVAGDHEAALQQAWIAYASGTKTPTVALFLAGLLLQSGDLEDATRILDSAEPNIPAADATGRHILATYRTQIAQSQ